MSEREPKKPATYQDVLDAPEHMLAEIIDGELVLSPRPRAPHAVATSAIGAELMPPFGRGRGGPGGWIIVDEPELHLGRDVVVPDLAAWRRERMPVVEDVPYFTLAPDWVCEVLSKSTHKRDRTKKLRIYARAGVRHAWLVHPIWRTLEVLRQIDGKWLEIASHEGDERVRVEPFDAIELDLASFWADIKLPSHAGEAAAQYELWDE